MTKKCCMCLRELPYENFHVTRANKSGRSSRCKECALVYSREWTQKNRERKRETMRRWNEANRDHVVRYRADYAERTRDRQRKRNRDYYVANRDELTAKMRQYRRENLESARERNRVWAQENVEKTLAASVQRRLDRQQHSDEDRDFMRIVKADPCSFCGEPAKSVDHIVPLARGGEVGWTNMNGACRRCNSSKGPASLLMFLRRKTIDFEIQGGQK